MEKYPTASSIEDFKKLLYTQPYVLTSHMMTPDEMAKLCGTRWISSDHMSWLAKTINKDQTTLYCNRIVNFMGDIGRLVTRLRSPKPKCCAFFVNAGKSNSRNVFLGGTKRGCHWTLCYVDSTCKQIVYGDTLGCMGYSS